MEEKYSRTRSEKEVIRYGWTTSSAQGQKEVSQTVEKMTGANTTVHTPRMSLSSAASMMEVSTVLRLWFESQDYTVKDLHQSPSMFSYKSLLKKIGGFLAVV